MKGHGRNAGEKRERRRWNQGEWLWGRHDDVQEKIAHCLAIRDRTKPERKQPEKHCEAINLGRLEQIPVKTAQKDNSHSEGPYWPQAL